VKPYPECRLSDTDRKIDCKVGNVNVDGQMFSNGCSSADVTNDVNARSHTVRFSF
jgi:hypothetical protein